jgi:predicted O-methyltransferase YrrM
MSEQLWAAVDRYIEDELLRSDDVLEAALEASRQAGLPAIAVSPSQGKLLHLIARLQGARRILEIGTLGGYSTIWLARALPDSGRLVTIEADPKHAEIARANIERAGLARIVDLRVGEALAILPKLRTEAPFDLVFIDADKPSNPDYFQWAVALTRKGSLIIVDNVVRDGEILDAASADPSIQGVRRMLELIAAENRTEATVMQMVGSKGYDGFAVILVTADPP